MGPHVPIPVQRQIVRSKSSSNVLDKMVDGAQQLASDVGRAVKGDAEEDKRRKAKEEERRRRAGRQNDEGTVLGHVSVRQFMRWCLAGVCAQFRCRYWVGVVWHPRHGRLFSRVIFGRRVACSTRGSDGISCNPAPTCTTSVRRVTPTRAIAFRFGECERWASATTAPWAHVSVFR